MRLLRVAIENVGLSEGMDNRVIHIAMRREGGGELLHVGARLDMCMRKHNPLELAKLFRDLADRIEATVEANP